MGREWSLASEGAQASAQPSAEPLLRLWLLLLPVIPDNRYYTLFCFFPGGLQSGSEAVGPWGRLGRSERSLPTGITLASCPLQLPAYLRKRGVNTE